MIESLYVIYSSIERWMRTGSYCSFIQ